MSAHSTRCGYVALLGAPNAGKSTLLNRMAGAKLSIVSPKAQTTRFRVLGIVSRGATQILLVDTPGIFRPRRLLDRTMVDAAWEGATSADISVLLVDARTGLTNGVRAIAATLAEKRIRPWLVLNKIDLVAPPSLLALTEAISAELPVGPVFMLSAATGDGVADLLDALAGALPESPHLYPDDDLTNLPDRLLAAELVREQIFLQTHQEVPYGAAVQTERFEQRRDGSIRIEAVIMVGRAGHKAILIGDGGSRIRAIGTAARRELESALEHKVHLFLTVLERPGWDESQTFVRQTGPET